MGYGGRALHGRAAESAVNFQFGAGEDGAQGGETAFDLRGVFDAGDAEIEYGAGALGDDVGARAAFDDAGADRRPRRGIGECADALDLQGEFVNRVHSLFRIQAGVRGFSEYGEFHFAGAFAGRFQFPFDTGGGLENEDGSRLAGEAFDEFAGVVAADFFVGGEEAENGGGEGHAGGGERFDGGESDGEARLHVERSGARDAAAADAEWHALERAERIDGVVMAEDQDGAAAGGSGETREDVIAGVLLREALDFCASAAALGGEQAREAVERGLVGAGGFEANEAFEAIEKRASAAGEFGGDAARGGAIDGGELGRFGHYVLIL